MVMQCKGKIRGGSATARAWHPVQVYFSTTSDCDLLSDSFAKEIGLELQSLYGCHTVQDITGTSTCQVATHVSIKLEVQNGSYLKFELPLVVVPKKEFCKYRKLILGMPFLRRGFHLGPDILSLRGSVNIKIDRQEDLISNHVIVAGLFSCTEELKQICQGEVSLSTNHICSFSSHESDYLSPEVVLRYLKPEVAKKMDAEFQRLLCSLTLSERDCHELLEKRGFQPALVEQAGFKSWPGGNMRLPFMMSKFETGIIDVHVQPSLLIPARTQDGRVTAIHIKPHRDKDTQMSKNPGKYKWASRNKSFKLFPVEGPSCEHPLFICAANKSAYTSVALIEGGLKAYAFAAQLKIHRAELHAWVIGAAGGTFCHSLFGSVWAMGCMQPQTVVLYPDAGAIVNPDVLLNYFRSFQVFLDLDMDIAVAWWGQWSKEEHLDADDFLIQGGSVKQIRHLSIPDFWKKIPDTIRQTLQQSGQAEVFNKVLQKQ